MRLREEIKKRRISEEDFAAWCGISYTWLRQILAGKKAGPKARDKIRSGLERCTVCGHHIDTKGISDDDLFAVAGRKKRKAA